MLALLLTAMVSAQEVPPSWGMTSARTALEAVETPQAVTERELAQMVQKQMELNVWLQTRQDLYRDEVRYRSMATGGLLLAGFGTGLFLQALAPTTQAFGASPLRDEPMGAATRVGLGIVGVGFTAFGTHHLVIGWRGQQRTEAMLEKTRTPPT